MLKLDSVTVHIGENKILDSLDLELKPASFHVLMGPNGSGKSSLSYALMGHPKYAITQGAIWWDSGHTNIEANRAENQTHADANHVINLAEISVEKRARSGLFLACQYPQEVPGVQVLTFLRESYRMLVGQDLAIAEFQKLACNAFDAVKLDHGFLYRNLHENFSGGEKKRLEIAQLLLFKPKLAILDEIDSGLDIDGLKIIASAIKQAQAENPQLAVLLITHYQRILDFLNPDFVHVLQAGKLVASGGHELAHKIEREGYREL